MEIRAPKEAVWKKLWGKSSYANCTPEYMESMNEKLPKALQRLKEITENKLSIQWYLIRI